ncbi:hypothetical protein FDC50_09970 [Clostridium botulinum]|nr:hypothetical protein [Clostridium botulinum]MBY6813355.1 hypothetical protein [Clostridium botulinum]MBY6821911.1 hypothetical protein [Clostridium botulinum]MBY6850518.1 hypothetical protein [Clostridium botulinum]NFF23574.1 hypothetical protein [Clostridium botulinum]
MSSNLVDLIKYKNDNKEVFYKINNPNEEINNILKNKRLSEPFGIDKEVATDMDENKGFEKILDRMDKDRREQEQRLSKNMQLMEQRITEERRLSEERMEKSFKEAMESVKSTNNKIGSLENKLDEKTERMLEKVDSTNKWIMGTCIATILAVAAIAASVWFK